MIKHKAFQVQDKVVTSTRIMMFIDRLYDHVFQSAHLVLHYQVNLLFMKAKIDTSTLVVKKDKGFIILLNNS